jgi:hypothetical protein
VKTAGFLGQKRPRVCEKRPTACEKRPAEEAYTAFGISMKAICSIKAKRRGLYRIPHTY